MTLKDEMRTMLEAGNYAALARAARRAGSQKSGVVLVMGGAYIHVDLHGHYHLEVFVEGYQGEKYTHWVTLTLHAGTICERIVRIAYKSSLHSDTDAVQAYVLGHVYAALTGPEDVVFVGDMCQQIKQRLSTIPRLRSAL